ncbi:hypothetical protein Y032_0366g10 [Ancylostoma ceylanicum]|uniref:Uncharacterized protein n=1 Tax=Ancylostoma ceylanicum TaxID=53326 RepID=A0A016RUW5_9BILA|nr:hypothetical protein Y032_0366g10 [Ancylostoma ceylanicum]
MNPSPDGQTYSWTLSKKNDTVLFGQTPTEGISGPWEGQTSVACARSLYLKINRSQGDQIECPRPDPSPR